MLTLLSLAAGIGLIILLLAMPAHRSTLGLSNKVKYLSRLRKLAWCILWACLVAGLGYADGILVLNLLLFSGCIIVLLALLLASLKP